MTEIYFLCMVFELFHFFLVSTLPSVKQNIPKTSKITEKLKGSPGNKNVLIGYIL